MKDCPRCGTPHDKPGTFCSRSCANSRVWGDTDKAKKSKSAKLAWQALTDEEKESKLVLLDQRNVETNLRRIMNTDWDQLPYQTKRTRVIIEQNGACNRCGITVWLGEKITLEYEHKDGNNTNNDRDNVEALCPNCHSLTTTWRGRKNGKRQTKIQKYINASVV